MNPHDATEAARRKALLELAERVDAELSYDGDKPLLDTIRLWLPPLCAAHVPVDVAVEQFLTVVAEGRVLSSAYADRWEQDTAESNVEYSLDLLLGRVALGRAS